MTTQPYIPAARYIRVSGGLRDYPAEVQEEAISQYAIKNNFVIVHTYSDIRKRGLSTKSRKAFQQLLEDVITRRAIYKAILVFDVSRWGRFQNIDQSAYYEYICSSYGIRVHYCAEVFPNDDSPRSLVLKTMKRLKAAEYSRIVSEKCFRGQKTMRNADLVLEECQDMD